MPPRGRVVTGHSRWVAASLLVALPVLFVVAMMLPHIGNPAETRGGTVDPGSMAFVTSVRWTDGPVPVSPVTPAASQPLLPLAAAHLTASDRPSVETAEPKVAYDLPPGSTVAASVVITFVTVPSSCAIVFNGTVYDNGSSTASTPTGSYSIAAEACSGESFEGWASNAGEVTAPSAPDTSLAASSSGTLTATFVPSTTGGVCRLGSSWLGAVGTDFSSLPWYAQAALFGLGGAGLFFAGTFLRSLTAGSGLAGGALTTGGSGGAGASLSADFKSASTLGELKSGSQSADFKSGSTLGELKSGSLSADFKSGSTLGELKSGSQSADFKSGSTLGELKSGSLSADMKSASTTAQLKSASTAAQLKAAQGGTSSAAEQAASESATSDQI
jgi:hypothetical protein